MPVKCGTCERPMDVPVFCGNCSALALANEADYFQLLNQPRQFDVDPARLRQAYLNVSREIHPDRFAGKSDDVAQLSLRVSSQINRAFEVLSDPLRRAEYLLELSGGKSASEDKSVSPAVLAEALELREEIDDARARGDTAALGDVRRRLEARRERRTDEIAALARALPGDESLRNQMRITLNDVKYDLRMLEQV
ncbi:MAG: Fe-S protein assembly co-chaperone HscB [Phycisphaerales bacterium]|nr:Fe-S protein assembly co-chaperone HscB [Phycisphaerales bacterium]